MLTMALNFTTWSKIFRPRRGFCPILAWLMLKAALYGSWLLGVFPFTFDSKRKQLRRSRWLQFYGIIGHFFCLCLFGWNQFVYQGIRKQGALERNPLLGQIHEKFGVIAIFTAIVTHFSTFSGSIKIHEIANELLSLRNQHFDDFNERNCPTFNCCVNQKSLAAMYQIFILLTFALSQGSVLAKILTLLGFVPLVSLHLIVMHFHIVILLIYRHVFLINRELVDLANNTQITQANPSKKSSRIRELAGVYNRLLKLNKNEVDAYDFQMALILAMYFIYNILLIFFLIVIGISMNKQYIYFVASPHLAVNIWDFWLNIVVCDITEKAGGKTITILKRFNDLENKDVELERSLNEFAWLCSHRKFQFKLCGLFQMIITNFLYMVYLVQFDYMNL
ncbi:putative gustatory receptor 22f [Drosophila biarmipes]|uniref:putative gustatory receptor 22f n=1 Tax=Drosophila biarmipes TaxID=125945 RepID=UPI001CDAD1E0|nr:putative gustatory receptor 22f [Drosophila biarmipes]